MRAAEYGTMGLYTVSQNAAMTVSARWGEAMQGTLE
jgi:hypothetical protein